MEEILIVGVTLSTVCVISLWTAWYLMPRWRTLHNYISVNQITFGTLHLSSIIIMYDNDDPMYLNLIMISSVNLFLAVLVWSLSSTLLAYFKLVLIHNEKISNEKVNMTVFVYGLTFLINTLIYVVKILCNLEFGLAMSRILPNLILIIVTLMIVLFIRIIISVMSCCKKKMSKRKVSHVVALLGVAIICDTGTVIWLFLATIFLNRSMELWFCLRLIPQTVFVLLNASSRAHWKWYFNKRRRMRTVV